MNTKDFFKKYIDHYMLLEEDFKKTFYYVTLEKENYNTYSSVYLKILLSIGSEVDILKKYLASLIKQNFNENKDDPNKIIIDFDSKFKELEVKLLLNDEKIMPWNYEKEPDWWTAYNEIKHNRLANASKFDNNKKYYQYANLKNVLYALSALYSLEMYVYRMISMKCEEELFIPMVKTLFCMNNSYWENIDHGRGSICIGESLYICDF